MSSFQSKVVKVMYVGLSTLFVLLLVGIIGCAVLGVWTQDGRWFATVGVGIIAAIVTALLAATIEET